MIAILRVPWNASLAIAVFCLACLSTTIECFEIGCRIAKHSVDSVGGQLCECFDLPLSHSRRTDAAYHLLRGVESGMMGQGLVADGNQRN
jgi:hypothetical protein